MKRRVIFDAAAARELRERRSYFGDVSPGAEQRLTADMRQLLDLIAEFPHLHEEYAPSLRRAVLPRWSRGIFYRSTPHSVLIAAVIDLRRDPIAIRHRLGLHEEGASFAP